MKKNVWALSALCTAFVLTSCGSKEKPQNDPIKVTTTTVTASTTVGDQSYVGVVEEESSAAVSFTSSGTLTRMCVSEGQHVSKGQLIAEIDKTQAQSLLNAAQATMKQAQDALDRMKQLHDSNSLPDMKWVEVQSKVDQAQASVDVAKKNLADCSVYAPISGVIGAGVKHIGETVLPSLSVCTILSINNVKVKVSIPEKEIASIQTSTPSNITIEAVGKTLQGGKIEKGVEADALSRTYDIKINLSNPGQEILPGMVCTVNLSTGKATAEPAEAIVVPVRCVQESADGKHFVWLAKNGQSHRQDVTLGETSGNDIVIASGLKKGDEIITEGYQKVSEGTQIIK